MNGWPDQIIAIIIALLGGGLIKSLIDGYLGKKRGDTDASDSLRDDLLARVESTRAQNDRSQQEIDNWRGRFWEEVGRRRNLETGIEELKVELAGLKRELAEAKAAILILNTAAHASNALKGVNPE